MSITKSKRVRRSADQWAGFLSDQRASGLSQVEFCKREGIALSTFARWRQQLAGADESTAREEPWIELGDLPGTRAGWDIELDLGDGICLRLRRG
jgi:hypothetical protein